MGIAEQLLEENKEVLHSLKTLYDQAIGRAGNKGGADVDDVCKIAVTIANIRRDAYMAEIAGTAQESLLNLVSKRPGAQTPSMPPDSTAVIERLAAKLVGKQVGMPVPSGTPRDDAGDPPKE